ncbi:hypothetical protein [Propionibacterium freudenreichii]|uniref:hypothetical protein n=3 Tax=Propionibacterium freudenreichii TaxID=1744 RepID=UPI00054443CE|nr:hypothetical protein [Propionibacterium freudenreichii]AJQ91917.1 Hypothetical protein RM25_2213 [Propionibacterium freudenreichii subsp. freudenreichii]MDK9342036.1 hypothetical protein [Propionibacterium freudenreichii]CEG91380.1 transporter protein [Propionibacterium freudenreichii]
MAEQDARAEHTIAEHQHGPGCGHATVQHGDHVDYIHGDHRHALHGDHYDEHGSDPDTPAEHTIAEHQHGPGCGHETLEHGDHVDYLHNGHRHALRDEPDRPPRPARQI